MKHPLENSDGAKAWNALGEMSEKCRSDLKSKHPELRSLPLIERLKVWWGGVDTEASQTWTSDDGRMSATASAIVKHYKGKGYFVRFGRLF